MATTRWRPSADWRHSRSKIDTLLAGAALAGTAYVLSIKGRTGHPGLKKLQGWNYAHRGLHGEGVPENSMKAFRLAVEQGYGAELDVHLLADGNLAVIHDSKLIRTTGAEGRIEDLTADQLKDYHLEGTEETIPLFSDVLALFEGKAPLIIELRWKTTTSSSAQPLPNCWIIIRVTIALSPSTPRSWAGSRSTAPIPFAAS